MVSHLARVSKLWATLVLSASVVACGGGEEPLKQAIPPKLEFGVDTVNRDDLLVKLKDLTVRERPSSATDVASALKYTLASPTVEQQKRLVVAAEGRARQIALPVVVPSVRSSAGFVDRLRWQTNPWGGQTASLQFSSSGARGLRVGLWVEKLPDTAVVRVFGPNDANEHVYSGQQINALLRLNVAKDGPGEASSTWWAPLVDGDSVVLALDLPPGETAANLRVSVPQLSYFVESPREFAAGGSAKLSPGASESCNNNAACFSNWSNERKATAHMVFQSGGRGYVCTGTLLNDATSSGTPYFLTAYHCISRQTEASSLQTHWFAESSACNSSSLSSAYTVRSGGAQLLQASQSTDTSFMRLNSAPPAGVYFAGWHVGAPTIGWSVTGVHHPSGDLKKISFGAVTSFTDCSTGDTGGFSCSSSNASAGRFVGVRWSSGVTEGGSSGSSIWATIPGVSSPRIIGQLYGGGASCASPTSLDHYGRLDLAYEAGLKTWLGASTPTPTPTPTPLPTPVGTSDPENGWWWNASESGRGFALEKRGNVIYLAGFMYTDSGRDVWYAGAFTQTAVGQFSGELREYQGGNDRVLTSVLQGPTSSAQVATAQLFFSASNAGVLRVTSGSVTQNIALTRFAFGSGASNASFESGWWWNPSDSGHGYFLEVQGSSLFGAVYTYYMQSGVAGWYTLEGTLSSSTSFQNATVSWFISGQSLTGVYRQPQGPFNSGTALFTATSATTGVLTFRRNSGDVVVNLQRFVF